jgi:FlaA1/EpsC-like NDP-sugar epimerase
MISRATRRFLKTLLTWCESRLPTREAVVVTAMLAVIFEFTYLAAFYVRGELLFRPSDAATVVQTLGIVLLVKLVIFYSRGFCHRPWRAARFKDLNSLLRTCTLSLLFLIAINYFSFYVPAWPQIPRSVLLLDWVFTILAVGGMQAVARSIHEELVPATTMGNERSVLVIDASEAGRQLALDLGQMRHSRYFVAGLLDDDLDHYGATVGRARVLGPVAMAPACAERLRVSEIIVREGAVFGSRLRALCDACAEIGVRVSIAENAAAALGAHSPAPRSIKPIRVRGVDIRDLLSRPQANLSDHDANVFPFLNGKTVLVTGAGGSIGSEICRQVMRFDPAKIILVERAEFPLFSIQRELLARPEAADVAIHAILCDITNVDRTDRLLAEHKPQIVFHAAAFKHVPLMESHPVEAIENNALATAALAELADAHGVETFVALSTDKAVHPTSIMGASKLVAERFLQSFAESSKTRFVAVRFGNVLGSSGSAVPIFEEQLSRRQPITITHPMVRRYFMTIDEAAQLVLLAGALPGRGGIYVLDMGDSIRITDLVHSLAFVMNIPMHEVDIEFCGLRPGEKLDEELFFEDERHEATPNPLVIHVHRPARSLDTVRGWLAELKNAAGSDPEAAAQTLMDIVSSDCSAIAPAPTAPASLERSSAS